MYGRILKFLELMIHSSNYNTVFSLAEVFNILNVKFSILESFNKQIDFSKAFDMVDHSILLRKL